MIKLIHELTFLLTSNTKRLTQKKVKPMINCVNPRYIQHSDQCMVLLSEYLRLNSRVNRGLA